MSWRVAYARAPYRIATAGAPAPWFTIRIGRRCAALEALLASWRVREAILLTAANPLGRRAPAGRNARLMARLRARTRRWPQLPAESGEGLWREPQLLVAAPPRRLAQIARLFRQNAIVRLRRRTAPALTFLR